MPAGRSSRYRPDRDGQRRSGRLAALSGRYLWAALAIPVLVAAGLYLTRGSGPAPAVAVAGPGPAAAPGAVTATRTPDPCGLGAGTGVTAGDGASSGTNGTTAAGEPCSVGSARVARMPSAVQAARSPAGAKRTVSRPAVSAPATAPAANRPAAAVPAAPSQQGTPADRVLALINQARGQAGLPALTFSAGLDRSASAHNLKMASGCGLSHQCPGEPAIGPRETAAGVRWTSAGENIGEAGPEAGSTAAIAQAAVGLTQDMLNEKPPDDGHRLNILSSSFHHIGIAVYRDGSGTVWLTQDFSD